MDDEARLSTELEQKAANFSRLATEVGHLNQIYRDLSQNNAELRTLLTAAEIRLSKKERQIFQEEGDIIIIEKQLRSMQAENDTLKGQQSSI